MTDWTPYERLVGFRFNAFLWEETERARYIESRRFRYPVKMFSQERVAHLSDATGIIRWPRMQEPERWKTSEEVLAWLKKEFGHAPPFVLDTEG